MNDNMYLASADTAESQNITKYVRHQRLTSEVAEAHRRAEAFHRLNMQLNRSFHGQRQYAH